MSIKRYEVMWTELNYFKKIVNAKDEYEAWNIALDEADSNDIGHCDTQFEECREVDEKNMPVRKEK